MVGVLGRRCGVVVSCGFSGWWLSNELEGVMYIGFVFGVSVLWRGWCSPPPWRGGVWVPPPLSGVVFVWGVFVVVFVFCGLFWVLFGTV